MQSAKMLEEEHLVYQQNKYQTLSLTRLSQPPPIPQVIKEDISMNFITSFMSDCIGWSPINNQNMVILWDLIYSKCFSRAIYKRNNQVHGIARFIVSNKNHGNLSFNNFWNELFHLQRNRSKMSIHMIQKWIGRRKF